MSAMAVATYCLVTVFAIAYVIFFVVITVGGFFDLMRLIKGIKTELVDRQDDGFDPPRPEKPHDL